MDNLQLRTIRSLQGMSFYIPSYQRGYRWTPQQVTDLLDDINDFIGKQTESADGFYCIQPLVVKEILSDSVKTEFLEKINQFKADENIFEKVKELLHAYSKWEVIDGQQRLTTVYLILKYLSEELYSLEYQTRQNTGDTNQNSCISTEKFLNDIKDYDDKSDEIYETIDYHHFFRAYENIKDWFKEKDDAFKNKFKETLLDYVQFIWYKAENEEPIKVFTRLNIGKISLTNAELIKAMFLNRSNFSGLSEEHLSSKQIEIASQWDHIEYSLQNDELWLFIHEKGYERPTRIDFIFDMICHKNLLEIGNEKYDEDEYKTFRYFDKYFKVQKEKEVNSLKIIEDCWKQVIDIFNIMQEWYSDIVLYHYVGFLIACGKSLTEIVDKWNTCESKDTFLKHIKESQIKIIIERCYNRDKGLENTIYETHDGPKTKCRPILLLHNIQTIIAQNKELIQRGDYQQGVFYKFPFHFYKKENWDIEHIDSNTENPLDSFKDQREWLRYAIVGKEFSENLKEKIIGFLNKSRNEVAPEEFSNLREEVIKEATSSQSEEDKWPDPENDKNKIWNYVLLDSGTNRGYGNSIFPAKRRSIIGKDRGTKYSVDEHGMVLPTADNEIELSRLMGNDSLTDKEKEQLNALKRYTAVSFIPPCTRNVFMKYYTKQPNNLVEWGWHDAVAYLENIKILLNEFI